MDETKLKRLREPHEIGMLIPNEDAVEVRFSRNNYSIVALFEGPVNGGCLAFMHRSRVPEGVNDEIRSIRTLIAKATVLAGCVMINGERFEYYRPSQSKVYEVKRKALEDKKLW